jgi:hypothetical protein
VARRRHWRYRLPVLAAPAQAGREIVKWPQVQLLDGDVVGRAGARAGGGGRLLGHHQRFCLRHNAHIESGAGHCRASPVQILTAARDRDPAVVRSYLGAQQLWLCRDAGPRPLAQVPCLPET